MELFTKALFRALFIAFLMVVEVSSASYLPLPEQSAENHIIVKREVLCPEGEYSTGQHCCQLCKAGTYKSSDCTEAQGIATCRPCKKGIEYTNVPNHDPECHICTPCDHGEGFEVQQNCTAEQNTICQCIENYFCNLTNNCKHCDPCDKCESGPVMKECTRHSNTECGENNPGGIIAGVVVGILAAAGAAGAVVYYFWRKKKKLPSEKEEVPLNPDIDLRAYLQDIVEYLSLKEMRLFVRKTGMKETVIDQITQDHAHDTMEQKVHLLNKWYTSRGQQGALAELINTLENIGCRSQAKDIYDRISSDATYKLALSSAANNHVENAEAQA
ncbi:tumor necrosis factor receptor superfamily member 6 isoform X2 [Ambystoma mexicanum]|uniref:tumor necrosis factor receptor superfamily member 6 isoform X2 n=1 Tax=Ambystoma mexicanum TaxID=8296 RepID=UPI0037E8520E